MRSLKLAGGLLGFAVIVFLFAPLALPSSARLERSIEIAAPPEVVFAAAAEPAGFSRRNRGDRGQVTLITLDPPRSIEGKVQFSAEDLAFVSWNFSPVGGGTRVTATYEEDYTYLRRYVTLGIDSLLGPQYEAALGDLKAAVEKGSAP